jgi:hypothetical protein
MLSEAKQKVAKIMPTAKTRMCEISTPNPRKTIKGARDMSNPKKNEARTSPRNRAQTETSVLPERKGWLYEANVIDQAGPILTEIVKETFGPR